MIEKPCYYCDYFNANGECLLKLKEPIKSCLTHKVVKRMYDERKENEKREIKEKKNSGVTNYMLMKEYGLKYAELRAILDK